MNVSKLAGRLGAVCGLVLAGLLLGGCQTGSSSDPRFANIEGAESAPAAAPAVAATASTDPAPATAAPAPAASSTGSGVREIDMIHVGDMLTITFADLPTLQPLIEERVKEDGTITLLQNQEFTAAGKTRGQLEKEIRERYVPKFFVTMTVSVKPQVNTQFFFVGGEVKTPNRQVYIGRMTVLKAISSAGDFTDFANKRKVQLTRADGHTYYINAVKARKDPRLDMEIFPGDTVTVPRRVYPW